MIVLGLDGATLTASAAVLRDGEVLAEESAKADVQAEALLPLIARVCERAGVTPRELDAVAVGAGPGSFTGLRIAMATAKGIAFAAGCPLWAVSSLQALAWAARGAAPVLVAALDARRGEIYAGVFDGDAQPLGPERALAPGALVGLVDDPRAVVLGDALDVYPDLGLPALSVRRTPGAADVARLALAGARVDVLTSGGPAYVRPAEAEVLYPEESRSATPELRYCRGVPDHSLAELTEEHRRLDELVRALERKAALTPAEQIEYSRLKKQKLLTKDRMARLQP